MLRTSLWWLVEKRLRVPLSEATANAAAVTMGAKAAPVARRAVMMKSHPRPHTVDASLVHKSAVHRLATAHANGTADEDRCSATVRAPDLAVVDDTNVHLHVTGPRQLRREDRANIAQATTRKVGVVNGDRRDDGDYNDGQLSVLQEGAPDEEVLYDGEEEPELMTATDSSRQPSQHRNTEVFPGRSSKIDEDDASIATERRVSTTVPAQQVGGSKRGDVGTHDCCNALRCDRGSTARGDRVLRSTLSSDLQLSKINNVGLATSSEAAERLSDAQSPGDGKHRVESSLSATSTVAAPSTSAYRFLLQHIDAEIAALQRRQEAVNARRQRLEERLTHRIRELFTLMESPWLLLPSDPPPPLPATAVEVFVKEQQLLRRQRQQQSATDETSDKLFVLACHKNYRSLPAEQKKLYETAAAHNATLRRELQNCLSMGSARFEEYCARVKECTASMVREGHVPTMQMRSLTVLHKRGSPRRGVAIDTTSFLHPKGAAMATKEYPSRRRLMASVSVAGRSHGSSNDNEGKQCEDEAPGDVTAAAAVVKHAERRRRQAGRPRHDRTEIITRRSKEASNDGARSVRGRPRKLMKHNTRSASIPLPTLDLLTRRKANDALGKSTTKPFKSQRAVRSKAKSGSHTASPRLSKKKGRGGSNAGHSAARGTSHTKTRLKSR